eukprot:TRINITY_DN699_c0_g2_i1.p1 TRINITY_DN699_c0_g2~~TRINITY_DN699_c0_g2_i1.p1  ORF type:complete len:188 (-),score=34.45 TRINITY_DN699_c0_g2_i1:236-799(-)
MNSTPPRGDDSMFSSEFTNELKKWDKLHSFGTICLTSLLELKESMESSSTGVSDIIQWQEFILSLKDLVLSMKDQMDAFEGIVENCRKVLQKSNTVDTIARVCSNGSNMCGVSSVDQYLFVREHYSMLLQQLQLNQTIIFDVSKYPPPNSQKISAYLNAWKTQPFIDKNKLALFERLKEADKLSRNT